MRPLCDITITNMNLASHGCMESMNAVLVSSIAASTFNTQLEAWEPFIEPFDGIFKYYVRPCFLFKDHCFWNWIIFDMLSVQCFSGLKPMKQITGFPYKLKKKFVLLLQVS